MSFQLSVHGRRRKAAAAVVVAGAIAGGSLMMGGGATAHNATTKPGWPHVGGSATHASARAQSADLVVQTKEVRASGVDVGPKGDSPGDFFVFEERAYKPGTKTVVGRDAARCESDIRTFQCSATLQVFGEGKIVIDGALFADKDNLFAITGGTGSYAGVGGTMRALDGPGNSSTLVFNFTR